MLCLSFVVRFTRTFESFPGFWSLGFLHFQIKADTSVLPPRRARLTAGDLIKLKAESPTSQEARRLMQQPYYKLDKTKRKSLQPTNQANLPKGWDTELVKPEPRVTITPMPLTPSLEHSFTHSFYGSTLMVGDVRMAAGLSKAMHKLEITKDQMLIDGHPQDINQGDLERIKEMIRSTR